MALSSPFLSVHDKGVRKCGLCEKTFARNEKVQRISKDNWESFTATAKEWSNLCIPSTDRLFHFTTVHSKLLLPSYHLPEVHSNCRTDLRTKLDRYRVKYPSKSKVSVTTAETQACPETRSRSDHVKHHERICFCCNTKRNTDFDAKTKKHLRKVTDEAVANNIELSAQKHLQRNNSRYYKAAGRYQLI